MKKFRIVRGAMNPYTGKVQGFGVNVDAETVKEAVKKEQEDTDKVFGRESWGGIVAPRKPQPVVAVYELVKLDEAVWKS